jgi:seryl-tRNA(Sec) selenium transferase
MKRIVCAALMAAVLATPAFAAKVYLKDGGIIQAKRVWRAGGKVQVLATRHTLTSFENSEIDLKRTFAKRRRVARRISAVTPQAQAAAAVPNGAAATRIPVDRKSRISLPNLPKLPERLPESLAPSSGAGGVIRQQKKEMSEKLADQ